MTLDEVIEASPVRVLDDEYYVSRTDHAPPAGDYFALISDGTETTVIAPSASSSFAPNQRQGPFRAVRLEVAVPFGAPGFVAAATTALAEAGVNVFLVSTFSFDYVLVKVHDLDAGLAALSDRGFPIA